MREPSEEEEVKARVALIEGVKTLKADEEGKPPTAEEANAKASDMSAIAQQKTKLEFEEIKYGITNEAAEKYVKKIVQENQKLKRDTILKDLEIKALSANTDTFIKSVSEEIEELKVYLEGMNGVFNTFVSRIEDRLKAHDVNGKQSNETTTSRSTGAN